MTSQESWPPVAKEPDLPTTRKIRWLWIPALLLVPAVGWGAYALARTAEAPPKGEVSAADALGALAHGSVKESPPTSSSNGSPPAVMPSPAPRAKTARAKPGAAHENTALRAFEEQPADEESGQDLDDAEGENVDDDGQAAGNVDDDGEAEAADADDDGSYWIQVASLRLKERADRMAAKLGDKGYDARSEASGGPRSGWWHVVRIGPYVTRLEAEKARIAFVRAEHMACAVVPRAHGPYHIQLASLRSKSRADREVRRLAHLGHNARVVTRAMGKRGTWQTIRVGPFDFETDAWGYLKLLENDGIEGEIMPRPKSPPPQETSSAQESPPPTETVDSTSANDDTAVSASEANAGEPPPSKVDRHANVEMDDKPVDEARLP